MGDGLMPQHFGHLLGLPAAVPPLPASPLVPRAGELFTQQRGLRLRHAADALFPDTPRPSIRFRVLDGLQVPGRGRHWRTVNRRHLADTKAAWLLLPGVDRRAVTSLFARYDRVLESDPMGLRRIALYELTALLHQDPRGCVREAARELGVDPDECEALAMAARQRPVRTAEAREGAERILDAWHSGQLRRAHTYASRIGDTGGDQRLDALFRRIARRRAGLTASLAQADRLEQAGDRAAAAALRLRAARTAVDEPVATKALLRSATGNTEISTRVAPDSVRLEWTARGDGPYRVLRGRDGRWTELTPATAATTFTDTTAPLGERHHYAVLPLEGPDDPRVSELPLRSAPVLFAPEVIEPRLTDARSRVTGQWQAPPGAREVDVERHPGGQGVAAGLDGFTDEGVAPGDHRYLVRCRYRTAAGQDTLSPGVTLLATVHTWPEAVTALDITPGADPGSIHAVWRGGQGAEVRLLDLPTYAPAEGTDLLADDLPTQSAFDHTPVNHRGVELRPPRGTRARLTAVSVLHGRARIGPSVRIELPAAVENLTVRREAPDQAHLTFDWPGDAGRVLVSWEQYGQGHERTVTKSAYLTRGGLRLDIGTAAARFRAEPVVLAEADVVIPARTTAAVELPAYLAISYDLVKPGWLAGSRRRLVLHAEYPNHPHHQDQTAADLPDFVLVARAGGTRKQPAPRPRNPADGSTVLRLSGAEIGRGEPVHRDIDLADTGESPPYTLRAFLLGPRADCTRLKEPPHERLVVR
ncbi:hypothetical protein [Streptomyces albipurpureus]|uniref:SaeA second Fn3-like domain-containing protein n=1 Tax=Streptomyces albipurpureus TaxID=2897419 RepID=A0ABT0UEF0_9ACTN|nr:hypothetical protein [Streptomyces sp. CWNU-1]MCM2386899.1 hypothetical protein [Streptomyces sp. CWNU-1]